MSGSFNELDVPPTLVSFAVGMSKASHTGTALLQHPGSKVYLLQIPVNEATGLPDYKNAMALMQAVCAGVQDKSVLCRCGERGRRRCRRVQDGLRQQTGLYLCPRVGTLPPCLHPMRAALW